MKRPYLSLTPSVDNPIYQHGNLVSILGALHALYVVSLKSLYSGFWIGKQFLILIPFKLLSLKFSAFGGS